MKSFKTMLLAILHVFVILFAFSDGRCVQESTKLACECDSFVVCIVNEYIGKDHVFWSKLNSQINSSVNAMGIGTKEDYKYLLDYVPQIPKLGNSVSQLFIRRMLNTSLKANDFSFAKKLESMEIKESNIPEVGANSFTGLSKMFLLSLPHNQIKTLHPNAFTGMSELTKLNIVHNNIQSLDEGVFNGLDSLLILNMTFNSIKRLNGKVFKGLRFLKGLHLNDNQLEAIDKDTFEGLRTIEMINLEGNRLKKITSGTFGPFIDLKTLGLSKNCITRIEDGSLPEGLLGLSAEDNQILLNELKLPSFTKLATLQKNGVKPGTQIASLPFAASFDSETSFKCDAGIYLMRNGKGQSVFMEIKTEVPSTDELDLQSLLPSSIADVMSRGNAKSCSPISSRDIVSGPNRYNRTTNRVEKRGCPI